MRYFFIYFNKLKHYQQIVALNNKIEGKSQNGTW